MKIQSYFLYNLLFVKESDMMTDKEFQDFCISQGDKKLSGKNNKNVKIKKSSNNTKSGLR